MIATSTIQSESRRSSKSTGRKTVPSEQRESKANGGTDATVATLASAPAGLDLRVKQVIAENGHAQRLRELGLYEGRSVKVLLTGNPLICRIGDSRFGICHRLARHIVVEPLVNPSTLKQSA